ncbi:hypothetical protein ACFWGN_11910 [Oerskovia sp. NPDC060338]|uniref:hypothetical protein n=1 Tax=Oerskovia sp. NPDC060338 TaxID=3347100 RepID=UPI00365096AE
MSTVEDQPRARDGKFSSKAPSEADGGMSALRPEPSLWHAAGALGADDDMDVLEGRIPAPVAERLWDAAGRPGPDQDAWLSEHRDELAAQYLQERYAISSLAPDHQDRSEARFAAVSEDQAPGR